MEIKSNKTKNISNESLTEDLDPIDVGVSAVFNDLIQKEYEQLNQYESAQITLEDIGQDIFNEVFEYIKDDIHIHIGMLQACLQDLNPSVEKIDDGKEKADELITEDLEEAVEEIDGFDLYDLTENLNENLSEDLNSSIPAKAIPRDVVYSAIEKIKPGAFLNVGYLNDVSDKYLQSKYTGGRGSEGNPQIRLFKATEIYGSCGQDYENRQAVKDLRASGVERKGSRYEVESELDKKIFKHPITGNEVLQMYPRSLSDIKVKYYVSVNDGDLKPVAKSDIEVYCRPAVVAAKTGWDPTKPLKLNLTKIYWIKNLAKQIQLGNPLIKL